MPWIYLLAEEAMSTTNIVIGIAGPIIGGLITFWTLYWTKGSKARIDEMKAEEDLERVDAEEQAVGYEQLIAQAEAQSAAEISRLEAHYEKEIAALKEVHAAYVIEVNKRLLDSFSRHAKCEEDYKAVLQRMSHLEGVMEGAAIRLKTVEEKQMPSVNLMLAPAVAPAAVAATPALPENTTVEMNIERMDVKELKAAKMTGD